MGDFRITIEAIGGHGCSRKTPSGQPVYGCDQASCPDCQARRFVEQLRQRGTHVTSAKLEHWPVPGAAGCTRTENAGPVDDILSLTGVRTGEFDDARPKQAGFARLGALLLLLAVLLLATLCPGLARADGGDHDGAARSWVVDGDQAGGGTTAPAAIEQPEGMSLRLSAGGEALFTGDASNTITPFARIEAVAPIPLFTPKVTKNADGTSTTNAWRWPQLEVTADLTGLPGGDAVDVTKLETFKAIELTVGVLQPVFRGGHQQVSFGVEAGFATRLAGSTQPRDRTARWGQVLAEVAHTEGAAYLRVGLGGDQRLDGDYRLVALVEGAVRLWRDDTAGATHGVEVRLVGDAILGLSMPGFLPSTHDCVRVGVVLSR